MLRIITIETSVDVKIIVKSRFFRKIFLIDIFFRI